MLDDIIWQDYDVIMPLFVSLWFQFPKLKMYQETCRPQSSFKNLMLFFYLQFILSLWCKARIEPDSVCPPFFWLGGPLGAACPHSWHRGTIPFPFSFYYSINNLTLLRHWGKKLKVKYKIYNALWCIWFDMWGRIRVMVIVILLNYFV